MTIGHYELACTFPGCTGKRNATTSLGMRLKVGDLFPQDPTDPVCGRCPKCLRHKMVVMVAPVEPAPPPPRGFTRVPTE